MHTDQQMQSTLYNTPYYLWYCWGKRKMFINSYHQYIQCEFRCPLVCGNGRDFEIVSKPAVYLTSQLIVSRDCSINRLFLCFQWPCCSWLHFVVYRVVMAVLITVWVIIDFLDEAYHFYRYEQALWISCWRKRVVSVIQSWWVCWRP